MLPVREKAKLHTPTVHESRYLRVFKRIQKRRGTMREWELRCDLICNMWSLFRVDGLPGGEGNGTPLQYSCLENPMDGGAWKAAVHGVAEGRTRLSDFTFTFHFHALEKEMETHSSILA